MSKRKISKRILILAIITIMIVIGIVSVSVALGTQENKNSSEPYYLSTPFNQNEDIYLSISDFAFLIQDMPIE